MKRCTYCGKEYPDEATICALDQARLESVEPLPLPPELEKAQFVAPERVARGRLSLGSFIKLSVIAATGCLPIFGVLMGLAFLVSLVPGHHPACSDDLPIFALWPILLLKAVTSAVSIVVSGFLAGMLGYPFYAWLCRRRGGVILKGKFDVF